VIDGLFLAILKFNRIACDIPSTFACWIFSTIFVSYTGVDVNFCIVSFSNAWSLHYTHVLIFDYLFCTIQG
jgi:hypothetical protein